MRKFYNLSDMSLSKACDIIRGIESDLKTILPELQKNDNDYRRGAASYGYTGVYATEDGILRNLQYISDRWCCAFRVAWVLGLINDNYK